MGEGKHSQGPWFWRKVDDYFEALRTQDQSDKGGMRE